MAEPRHAVQPGEQHDTAVDPAATAAAPARAAAPLAEAISIMARLRAPGGCPWDREQTFDSIKRHTLEETYEVFDAIERRAWPELKDELGDLLLQVLFYAQMAAEAGYFDIADVAAGLNAKLIRRHPHVFPPETGPNAGELVPAADASAVLRNWEQIKRQEKQEAAAHELRGATSQQKGGAVSGLDDIPRAMPAALEAGKLGSRAAKVGFDWPDAQGLFAKLDEEITELRAEVDGAMGKSDVVETVDHAAKFADAARHDRVEEEMGDLLFTAVNLARHLKVDAESALRAANAKFRARFRSMEASAGGFEALASHTPEQLEALWAQAKQASAQQREKTA